MLVAVLNCCTKEELDDSSDEESLPTPAAAVSEKETSEQRRRQIKNKILAVGRMSRVFALLRCVTFVICCASMI